MTGNGGPPVRGSAHLRTLREAAGLTLQAASDLAGVSLRAWQYWESPDSTQPIKPDVYALLSGLVDRKAEMVDAMLDRLETMDSEFGDDGDEPIVQLTRYRSQEQLDRVDPGFPGGIGAHSAVLAAILDVLGDRVLISWAPES